MIPKLFFTSILLVFINAQVALPTFQAVHKFQTTEVESDPQTFSYTGAQQTFTVPSGVTSIIIDAYGAEGDIGQRGYSPNVAPGKGARVQANLSVTAGEVLYIYIGGEGSLHNNSGDDGEGGWNGGGDGGSWGSGGGYYGGGGTWEGAGGGSSWVTTSGSSNISHTQGARSGDGTMVISW